MDRHIQREALNAWADELGEVEAKLTAIRKFEQIRSRTSRRLVRAMKLHHLSSVIFGQRPLAIAAFLAVILGVIAALEISTTLAVSVLLTTSLAATTLTGLTKAATFVRMLQLNRSIDQGYEDELQRALTPDMRAWLEALYEPAIEAVALAARRQELRAELGLPVDDEPPALPA